jgi:hypothetical protein
VNGILLYDKKDIDSVYKQTLGDRESILCQSISQDIFSTLNNRLFDLYSFDTLRVKDLFERILGRTQDEFKTSTQVQISTARKFLERYPTLDQQEAQLKTTFQKSEPFLRFSKEQVSLGWDDIAEKRQKLVGIQGGTKPTDPAVEAILPILRKVSALDDKNIKPLNDPHRVYFIHEVGAFPLRLIEGIDKMRNVYRSIAQSDANPLHTHQENRQFKDLLPAPQEEAQVKQNLRLGVALGLINTVENRATGFSEVRISYPDKQTGLEQTQILGATLQEAEDALLSDAAVNLRNILSDALIQIGKSAVSKPDKQALYQRLITYLEDFKQNLPNGADNPTYAPVKVAIEEYIKIYSLFIVSATSARVTLSPLTNATQEAPAPPLVPLPAPTASVTTGSENIEKFRKLVQTCYKKGMPTSTELQLLEKFRTKYGIDPTQAEQIAAEFIKPNPSDSVQEYSLMFRAFVESDSDIDLEEQGQLLELQDELGLTIEQANIIEQNIREELGLST